MLKPANKLIQGMAVLLIMPLCACAGNTESETQVSLNFDLQPLLNAQCVHCHFIESAQAGLILESGEAYSSLVNISSTQAPLKLIVPGMPDESYLMHKLRGTHLSVGGSGAQMPYGAEQSTGLAVDDLNLIQTWIEAGAPDN